MWVCPLPSFCPLPSLCLRLPSPSLCLRPSLPFPFFFPNVTPWYVRNVHARWDRGTGSQGCAQLSCSKRCCCGRAGRSVWSPRSSSAVLGPSSRRACPPLFLLKDNLEIVKSAFTYGATADGSVSLLDYLFSFVSPPRRRLATSTAIVDLLRDGDDIAGRTDDCTIISTTVPMTAPAGVEGANSTQAHNISPTTEESSRN